MCTRYQTYVVELFRNWKMRNGIVNKSGCLGKEIAVKKVLRYT